MFDRLGELEGIEKPTIGQWLDFYGFFFLVFSFPIGLGLMVLLAIK